MFRAIGAFLRTLWRISMFWRIPPFEDASAGVRVGSPLGGGLMFLFLLFAIIALILVVVGSFFGFSVEDTLGGVDAWLGQMGPSLDFVGKLALKALLVIVLALCVFFGVTALHERFRRKGRERPGWISTIGILLLCLMLGYCSAVNIVAPFERYDPSLGSQHMD
jgi:hypothetical protein